MTSLTPEELLRWRLHALRLAGPPLASPQAVVEHLLCVQGEQMGPTAWALASRCGAGEEQIHAALDHDVLRTHVLRSTWHLVRPADIGWVLDLCRERLVPVWTRQMDAAGLDEQARVRGVGIIEQALTRAAESGAHLTRPELADALATSRLPVSGMPLGHLLGYAETLGVMCSGVPRWRNAAYGEKREHTYALLDERVPERRRLDRDESLAEVARRYVTGHGPVTERDLSYWATLTVTDARAGLSAAAEADPGIHRLEVGGTSYWCRGEPVLDAPAPRAHLLHIFDEAYRGFQDSRPLIDREGLMVKGRESSLGMLLVDGQILGSVKRTVRARDVRFDLEVWRPLRPEESGALEEAAQRYGAWLGREPLLDVQDR